MAAGRANFEIQTFRDGHWVTSDFRETELTARAQAKQILAKPDCQGVRVVKNWTRADGLVTETVVATELRDAVAPRVTIVPIDESPYCQQTQDYYRLNSRATINRLLRKYVDQVFLTPTELIHHYKSLKRLLEVETLFPAAVDRIAAIQARDNGLELRGRRDDIFRSVAQMSDRARRADEFSRLPKLSGNDFDSLCERLEHIVPPGESDFYALVLLSRELVKHRNWLSKLERLVAFTHPDQQAPVMLLLDGVIADIFGVASALQDVLGYQRNLAEAICALLDLYEGRAAPGKGDAGEQIAIIAPMIADGRLSETRQSLLDRVLRQLASAQPLSRNDPSLERDAFRQVARRLFRSGDLLGGADAAEALARRYVYLQEAGGRLGLRRAVSGVISLVDDPLFAVVFLSHLAQGRLAADLKDEIATQFRQTLSVASLDALVPPGASQEEHLALGTALYGKVTTSAVVTGDDRVGLLDHLDRLLCLYLKGKRVIEKMDDPTATLLERATRLIEFCASDLLPANSRAAAATRGRVVALLKQPNFETHLIAGVSDAGAREEVLRRFHALLERAGFR